MEDPVLQDVLDFLTKRGFSYAAAALREDIFSSAVDGSDPVLPSVKTKMPRVGGGGFEFASSGTSSGGSDDFVSMGSSPSELRNPYGIWSPSRAKSDDSSDRNSEFRTARDHDFNIFSDTSWYGDHPSGYLNNSYPGFLNGPLDIVPTNSGDSHSEDKFVLSVESAERLRKEENENYDTGELPSGANNNSKHGESYNCLFPLCNCCNGESDKRVGSSVYGRYRIMPDHTEILDEYGEDGYQLKQMDEHHEAFLPINDSFHGPNQASGRISFAGRQEKESKMLNTYEDVDNLTNGRRECEPIIAGNSNYHDQPSFVTNAGKEERHKEEGCNMQFVTEKGSQQDVNNGDGPEDRETIDNGFQDPGDVGVEGEEHDTADDLQLYSSHEDEYEIFDLRVIHRKNRTGFEENKDLPIVLNSVIAGRYYVTEYLGSAAFSKVVQAHDLYAGVNVCLKIIKNDKDFFDQSLDEIKLLKFVNKCDPADEHHILRLYDYFYHQEHLFIVCELLRANLYDYQKYNHDSCGEDYFTLPRIQSVARQCLEALDYLHHLRIIHCDLKPENILMKSYSRCEIKIIDLGSSCFLTDKLCLYVQSRSYRAPEVILGLPYDQKIDIWSLGCILVELYTGEVLFPNDSLPMMLARMIGILGLIDMEMLEMGRETYKYFTDDYDLYNRNEETDQVEYLIPEKSSLAQHLEDSDTAFIDFVSCLLQINPKMRPTASQALEHQWLSFPYH